MAKQTIFIGSANESRNVAAAIARALADAGYLPLRWWQEFPAGSITVDRLVEIAAKVDGAVFLLAGIDKTWYRQELLATPRDNVVLEYGLFVGRLGRERTLVIADAETKLPSDINAVNFLKLATDTSSVAERAVTHFDIHFADSLPPPLDAVQIIADPDVLAQQIRNPLPPNWYNRDLYFGVEGAKAWLDTVTEPSYSPPAQEVRLRQILLKALDHVEPRTFVSLGPGDALTDIEIAIRLRQREPWLQYIPVDISDGLLQRAVTMLTNQVRVPVGILGDFEDRLNFINRQLRIYGAPPMLFALLGNTLGDLDHYEGTFLSTLRSMMKPADFLLLDVSLAGPNWERSTDRRGSHSSYGPAYRRFIATGVARRTGESREAVIESFDSRISFQPGSSDVPGTKAINVYDTRGQRLVCTIQRYDWQSLLQWLSSDMRYTIVFHDATFLEDGSIGDGVIVLRT